MPRASPLSAAMNQGTVESPASDASTLIIGSSTTAILDAYVYNGLTAWSLSAVLIVADWIAVVTAKPYPVGTTIVPGLMYTGLPFGSFCMDSAMIIAWIAALFGIPLELSAILPCALVKSAVPS